MSMDNGHGKASTSVNSPQFPTYTMLCLVYFMFISINIIELKHIDHDSFSIYMDNQSLCNEGFIKLGQIQTGVIYSHQHYHDGYMYFPDHQCSITIQSNRRTWISVESFQANSTTSFPRCTEAKYAGNDDRLEIIDGYRNGSTLRIVCGKDSDQRFDRSPLILKTPLFTLNWQTKSQSLGFRIRFIIYDLAVDGSCPKSNQFRCRNNRCIDENLLCLNFDPCGDRSYLMSDERNQKCPSKYFGKVESFFTSQLIIWLTVSLSLFLPVVFCICVVRLYIRRQKSKGEL